MPNRNIEGNYRYKFQGQEKDPETGKEAFELRQWDGRIGRWLNPDPVKQFNSPYLGMGNDPVRLIDRRGNSVWVYSEKLNKSIPVLGHLAGHLFLRVKTDKIDVTIELQGQKTSFDFDGDGIEEKYTGRTGTPVMRRFYPKHFKNGRGSLSDPILVSAGSPGYEVERRIFQGFSKFIRREKDENDVYDFSDLPDYDAFGPNSNGFVQFLLQGAGNIKLNGHDGIPGHPGIDQIDPYYDHIHTPDVPDDGQN